MMNILVTGGTGFVGKNLIPYMKRKGYQVHILVRPQTNISIASTDNVYVFADDAVSLGNYLKNNRIEGIIHLASLYLNQHKPEQIKDLILSNIYLGTVILEAAVISGVKWFLNTGTIWQNYNVPPFSKLYCPVNLYAATKQAFIDMAKYYTETNDIRFCTLKLCDTYGPHDTRKKIYSLFEQTAKTGELLQMSPGEQKIDIVHIDKVVENFELLVERLHSGKELEDEYVVSSGIQRTLKDIVHQYELEHNVKLNIEWGARPYRNREVMNPYIGNMLIFDNISGGGGKV